MGRAAQHLRVTDLLFRQDPYLLEFDAAVVSCREHEGQPAVVLDRTAFYAESGGQPWDTGRLRSVSPVMEAQVTAVHEVSGAVVHVLDRALPEGAVRGYVDRERREDHRQQHHGQHLLSRAFIDVAQARTTSFHLGALDSSIDLDRDVSPGLVEAAERRTNEIVWAALPVSVRVVTAAEAGGLGLTVPKDAGDAVRLVDAGGFDLQPCGGTHPRNTAEVGAVLVSGVERHKGGTRVRFVCGHRARSAFHEGTRALSEVSRLLSTPPLGTPEAVQRLLAQQAALTRRSEDLLDRALDGEARRLLVDAAPGPAPVIQAAYDGWSPEELRVLALHLVRLRPCIALLGSRGERAHLVFAQSEGLAHDVPALLKEAVAAVGGRGGGRGNLAQGGGDRPEALDAALTAAGRKAASAGEPLPAGEEHPKGAP